MSSIGPYTSYDLTAKVAILAKLQVNYGARNRAEGTRPWIQSRISF